jgi:asparagine synthase (glutamine-hydrolysing)
VPLDYVAEALSPECLRDAGLFDPVAVGHLLEKCRSGRAGGFADNQAFVGVLSTMLLHRQLRDVGIDSATLRAEPATDVRVPA